MNQRYVENGRGATYSKSSATTASGMKIGLNKKAGVHIT
jgi:hypothetical protein